MSIQTPQGLLLAIALGLVAMLASFAELYGHMQSLLTLRIVDTAFREMLASRPLVLSVLRFAGAQLLLHAAFGALCWLLAVLTERAVPALAGRRRTLVVAWFVAGVVCVGVANVTHYPWSVTAAPFRLARGEFFGLVRIADFVASLFVAAATAVIAVAAWRSAYRRLWLRGGAWSAVALVATGVVTNMPKERDPTPTGKPNVIILGIDSLRTDILGLGRTPGYTPNLQAFLAESHVFPDTFTPLARTFPAWVSLLTGRSPHTTNARENLIPRRLVRATPTLGDRLRAAGYRTLYATDEVRFANIDTSFGFDATLTPPIGAADFVLGQFNDVPLANIFSNTLVARVLFPETYANRAAAVTYRPATFVRRVEAGIDDARPLFLAMHLTLPHWPYHWAEDSDAVFSRTTDNSYAYLSAVTAVDRQFGEIIRVLEDKGVLDNAIVVVLSDHGEAIGVASDNLIPSKQAKAAAGRISIWMTGHGTSVLSPHQYRVLLGVRGMGAAEIDREPTWHGDLPLTLEDVAPTLVDLLGLRATAPAFDGVSFAGALSSSHGQSVGPAPDRLRFTETAYTTPSLRKGALSTQAMLEGVDTHLLFAVNPETGRLEARDDGWDELLAVKERAVIGPRTILAALPGDAASGHKYVWVPRQGGLPRRLLTPPEATDDAELVRLWDALHRRFEGELDAPVGD